MSLYSDHIKIKKTEQSSGPVPNDFHSTGTFIQKIPGNHYRTAMIIELPKWFSWTHARPLDPDSGPGNLLTSVNDQGKCGSCWAWASAEMLSDRISILTKGKVKEMVSPQWVIDCICDPKNGRNGCCGGDIYTAITEIAKSKGLPMNEKYPYTSINTSSPSDCCGRCRQLDDSVIRRNFLIKDGKIELRKLGNDGGWDGSFGSVERTMKIISENGILDDNIREMKLSILMHGPIACGYIVYNNQFTDYAPTCKNGYTLDLGEDLCIKYDNGKIVNSYTPSNAIYEPDDSKTAGGHAIEIVGWSDSTEDHDAYWIIKNSWGTESGIDGYYYAKMGTKSGYELMALSAVPDCNVPSLKGTSCSKNLILEDDKLEIDDLKKYEAILNEIHSGTGTDVHVKDGIIHLTSAGWKLTDIILFFVLSILIVIFMLSVIYRLNR